MAGRPVTSWRVAAVALRAVGKGATPGEAAELAGVSRSTVDRLLSAHHGVMPREIRDRVGALTMREREEIRVGIELKQSDSEIGRRLDRHRSTIWREINRNGGRGNYLATRASRRAETQARRLKRAWTQSRPWL